MRYAVIENGEVINFAEADESYAAERGWVACPSDTQLGWLYDGAFFSENPEIIAKELEALTQKKRESRNYLLADSDWRVTLHAEKGESLPLEWATYRQALRDVPAQPGFPREIVWPIPPE